MCMGRIDVILDDDLEKRFRTAVLKKLGYKKGNITIAIEQAIKNWIRKA